MAMKGSIVKVFTGNGSDWVPGIVTGPPNDDGKQFIAVFPGNQKDSENLQADCSVVESGPGTGKYDHQPL